MGMPAQVTIAQILRFDIMETISKCQKRILFDSRRPWPESVCGFVGCRSDAFKVWSKRSLISRKLSLDES
jgi:hypothetical protein